MADSKYKKILDNSPPAGNTPDSDLFTTPIIENPSENQVFAQPLTPQTSQPQPESENFSYHSVTKAHKHSHFLFSPQIIIVMIVFSILILLLFVKFKSSDSGTAEEDSIDKTLLEHKLALSEAQPAVPEKVEKTILPAESNEPFTIQIAREFYENRNYEFSFLTYSKLYSKLIKTMDDPLLADYFRFEQAVCKMKLGENDQASSMFENLSNSSYPVIRCFVDYHSSLICLKNRQYLDAMTRAYKTLTMLWAVDFDEDLFNSTYKNCHFIIAESLTKQVLLTGNNQNIPDELWPQRMAIDPFFKVEDNKLNDILRSAKDKVDESIAGPKFTEHSNGLRRWNIVSNYTPIEELLTKFSGIANVDISWKYGQSQVVSKAVRKRNVSLYFPAITAQQFIKIAAGSIGLIAVANDGFAVNIINPSEYDKLSSQNAILREEAASLWQKYLMTFKDDMYIPNAHFALGLLYEGTDNLTNAISEYKIVSTKNSRSPLSPYACLNSSKLKERLKDIEGARSDLSQIIEQYPNSKVSDRAFLYFADLTRQSKLYEEAIKIYGKLYSMTSDKAFQMDSAYGAGMSCAEIKDNENAIKWLTRYVNVAEKDNNPHLYKAHYTLGTLYASTNRYKQACQILEPIMSEQLSPQEYLSASEVLIHGYIMDKNYSKAIAILEKANRTNFTESETVHLVLLKNKIFKSLGLYDRAIGELNEIVKFIADSEVEMKVNYELAKCFREKGDLESASRTLSQILVNSGHGQLLNAATVELAEVCLELNKDNQTISLCNQVLEANPDKELKAKAKQALSKAYSRKKDYDKAAISLLGDNKDSGK